MSDTALNQAELVVRTIAQTAVDNETYFCELDAVVGDEASATRWRAGSRSS